MRVAAFANIAFTAGPLSPLLLGEKYTPTLIRPYDMFPRTFHVETLVCLRKK